MSVKTEKRMKFSGLSSPEELIDMWKELKHDDDPNDLNVIWDYQDPKQLKKGFNIVNILYNPETPDETGHYCLITVNDKLKEIEYFNPVASHTGDDRDKLKDLLKYFSKKGYDAFINLEGKQKENSSNCGYHCLTHAYNYYVNEENKMWPPAKVETFNGDVDDDFSEEVSRKKFKDDDDSFEKIEDLLDNLKKMDNLDSKRKRSKGYSIPQEGGITNTGDFEEDLLKVVRGIYYGLKYGFNQQTPERKMNQSKIGRKASGLADEPGKNKYYTYTGLREEME